ncbi:ATP synthase subunit I [Paenibacillus senegalimassiliensis]|uniref:ATP synthase subunit I n=1 Tax=Paenibacillus senegalimassiliensis TaxID=1737426 RepID=UPI00073F9069|nr:ATP synthase subunit I [Paenibacillus senegalimassiliensis]
MDDLNSIVATVTRTTLMLLSALLLGWVLLPEQRPLFAGLLLGLVGGLSYTRFLSVKVRQLAEIAVSTEKSRFSFGLLTRICLVLLTVMVAVKLEQVSLAGTLIGFFVPQLLTIPTSIVVGLRNKS